MLIVLIRGLQSIILLNVLLRAYYFIYRSPLDGSENMRKN